MLLDYIEQNYLLQEENDYFTGLEDNFYPIQQGSKTLLTFNRRQVMDSTVKLFDSCLNQLIVLAESFYLMFFPVASEGAIEERQVHINNLFFSLSPSSLPKYSTGTVIEKPGGNLLSDISRVGRLDRSPKSICQWAITPLRRGSYEPETSNLIVDIDATKKRRLRPNEV